MAAPLGDQPCCNIGCDKSGSLRCSACKEACYCSRECQLQNWKAEHKAKCKARAGIAASVAAATVNKTVEPAANSSISTGTSSSSSKKTPMTMQQVEVTLHHAKVMTQQAFRANDLTAALRFSNESMQLASLLSEPRSSVESTTILLRLSSIYAQQGDLATAMTHCNKCLERANAWHAIAGEDRAAALEIIMAGHGTKSHLLLNMNKLTEAEVSAKKACEIATEIFPPNNARNYRPIRALALVHEKQGKRDEAERGLTKGYELLLAQNDPLDTDFMQAIEELISFIMSPQQQAVVDQESRSMEIAQKHYDALVQIVGKTKAKGSGPKEATEEDSKREELIFGDAIARLASLKFRRFPAEAEELMGKVLTIREKNIGPDTAAVGVTLVALSEMKEVQNKIGPVTEALLTRALAIFEKTEGSKSQHAYRITEKIARLRARRDGIELPYTLDEGDLEPETVLVDSKGKNVTSSAASAKKSPASASAAKQAPAAKNAKRTPPPLPAFEKGDGRLRFDVALRLIQDDFFEEAMPIAQQAYELFVQQFGEDNPNTQAAKRNAMIARFRFIDELWEEVYQEQCALMDAGGGTSSSATERSKDNLVSNGASESQGGCVMC